MDHEYSKIAAMSLAIRERAFRTGWHRLQARHYIEAIWHSGIQPRHQEVLRGLNFALIGGEDFIFSYFVLEDLSIPSFEPMNQPRDLLSFAERKNSHLI